MKRALAWLLVVGLLFVPAFPDPPLRSGSYVQAVTARSAVVARIEPEPVALSCELGRLDGTRAGEQRAAPRRRHAFAFAGLEPATEYRWLLRDAQGQIEDEGRVKTAPENDAAAVRFLVVGDSGGLPWWVWLQNDALGYAIARYDLLPVRGEPAGIGARMAAAAPDLWLHAGDVVYPWGAHAHYRAGFFRPFGALLRQAPCYAVLGNHDTDTDGGRQLLANLVLPENEITGDERLWSVAFGSLRFVGLDLYREITADDPALRFLDQALADAAEPWRIVLAHFPIVSASRQGDRQDLVEHLLPRLERHGVDVLFTGHDHTYQRFGATGLLPGPALVVSGGGGKSLYELRVHPQVKKAWAGYHFCQVDVEGPELRLQAIALDGEVIDAFSLDLRRRVQAGAPDPTPRGKRIAALLGR